MKRILFSFILIWWGANFVFAQDTGTLFNLKGMEKEISLDLRNIDVVDALKFLSMKAGVNIVSSKKVNGRVNLMIEQARVKDIFDIMLRANGLAFDLRDNIYNVMTEEEYKILYGKTFSDVRQVKIFRIQYAIPEQIFSLCDALKSDIGRVVVDPESGAVAVMDSADKIKEIETAVGQFESQNVIKVFSLNYAKAKDVAEQLKNQLDSKKAGSVRPDERSNQIVVQTFPERLKQIEELIAKLDCKTKEVLLDAKIVKVKLNTDITESVEWEGLFSILKTNGFTYLGSYPFSSVQAASDVWRSRDATFQAVGGVGSYPFSGTSTAYSASHPVTGLEGMHIGMVNKDQDFDAFIKAFKDIGETQIVSTPKITVVNNQEAKIHVGEKQAYVTTTTTTGQSTSTIAEDVTFVDVGTQLYVTPEINEQGFITLKVKSEISSVVSLLVTPSNNRIPIIDTSLAETTVMTKNGSSILIGGLRKDDKSLTETSVPILGSLPLVGKLFKSSMPKKGRTELLIMITPTIIEGDTLVDARGQVVGEEPIKKIKDYDMIKESPQLEPASVQPKAEQKINMIKGLKFRE